MVVVDISKLKPEKISRCAKGRVIEEFFPNLSIDEIIMDIEGDSNE